MSEIPYETVRAIADERGYPPGDCLTGLYEELAETQGLYELGDDQ